MLTRDSIATAALLAGLALTGTASATVLDDFNSGTLVVDVLFDDAPFLEVFGPVSSLIMHNLNDFEIIPPKI